MSHTTTLKGLQIKSVSALRAAVEELQAQGITCSLLENKVPRMYFANQHGISALVLNLPNCPYDIGFDLQTDGSYLPVLDTWSNKIEMQIGSVCPMPTSDEGKAQHAMGRFLQSYAKQAAIEAATQNGYMVESATADDKGTVHLVLTGM